jgi:hypothetical protein
MPAGGRWGHGEVDPLGGWASEAPAPLVTSLPLPQNDLGEGRTRATKPTERSTLSQAVLGEGGRSQAAG